MGQKLRIYASRYLEGNNETCPTGNILPVAGTTMDFRAGKPIGRDIDTGFSQTTMVGGGYDHCFVIDRGRCGTCLDHYGIKDQLAVGEVTNMYVIVEKMEGCQCRDCWRTVPFAVRDGLPAVLPDCLCAFQIAKLRVVPFCSFPHPFPIRGFPQGKSHRN